MPTNEDQLEAPRGPLDSSGRTAAEAMANDLTEHGEELHDWLVAKDRHSDTGGARDTAETEPKEKGRPGKIKTDPSQGNVAQTRIERIEPKSRARIYPRTKFRPNDPSKTGASRS